MNGIVKREKEREKEKVCEKKAEKIELEMKLPVEEYKQRSEALLRMASR